IVIQANKDIVPGAWLMCARTADPDGVWMLGQVRSYTKATGALVLVVATGDTKGTGTFNDWTLSLSSARSTVFNAVDLALVGPSIRPSLLCDFANSKRLDSRFTYTMASPISYYDAAGVLRTAPPGVPAFDHDPVTLVCRGLPMWESRTNSIRNNTMQGAAAGTPGTAPTNWSITSTNGLSSSVVGSGTEDGIAYIDVRFFGTASSVGASFILFETSTGITAANGQNWTAACYVKTVGGSAANISAPSIVIDEKTAAGVYVAGGGAVVNLSSSLLRTSRQSYVRALSGGATVARVVPYLALFNTAIGSVDITLRVGLPTAEQGASATSVIATSGSAVTRSAPTPAMPTSAFDFNAAEGSIHIIFNSSEDVTQMCAVELSDGTASNLVTIPAANTSGVGPYGEIVVGGVTQAAMVDGNLAANALNSAVLAYKADDFAFCRNGRSVVMDASGAVPPMSTLILGRSVAGNSFNGWLSKFAYYPRRLTNAEMVALSTL
ncbi:MAG: hypothetical protein K2X55_27145, partial [Burkholderiaceae bacterium]|nr:hypothetical protein [Burkholderiaceae bacterium]